MKKVLILILITCFYLSGRTQSFHDYYSVKSYKDAIRLSKLNHKNILIYYVTDGCRACLKMEKTVFENQQVFSILENSYIFCTLNARKGEGLKLNKKFKTYAYPTLIITDSAENIINSNIGSLTVDEFFQFCNDSRLPINIQKKMYFDGVRNQHFLYEYCYALFQSNDCNSIPIMEYLNTQTDSNLFSDKNIKIIYDMSVINAKPQISIYSSAYNFLFNNRDLFYNKYDSANINGRIVYIAKSDLKNAFLSKDLVGMNKCIKILDNFNSEKTLRVRERYYKTAFIYDTSEHQSNKIICEYYNEDSLKFNKNLRLFIKKINNDSEMLDLLAWKYCCYIDDSLALSDAETWSRKSISIANKYSYYETLVNILIKEKKFNEALINAKTGIHYAKNEGTDASTMIGLISQINKIQSFEKLIIHKP